MQVRTVPIKTVFALGLAAAALTGCASKEAQVMGKWKFKDVAVSASKDSKGMDQFAAGMAKAFLSSTTVEFKQDHTFTMTLMMFPIEGDWSLSGSTVTMTPKKVMGMDATQVKQSGGGSMKLASTNPETTNKPMTASISDDGKTLTLSTGKSPMTFSKE